MMTVNILPHCHVLVRIRLLQQVLPLSQDFHAIGCNLDNEHLKCIARHLSEFIQQQSTVLP